MLVKILKIIWPYILIIIFGIIIYFLIMAVLNITTANQRLSNNIEQILLERDSKVLEITKKEFNNYYVQQDSLLNDIIDSLKLKYKHIERTINHKYTHSFDTTITMIKEVDPKKDTIRTFRLNKDCVKIIASINWGANTATLDTVDFSYNATTVYHWDRKRKFWFIKFGKKEYYAVTKNNCTGKTKVIDIKFKK